MPASTLNRCAENVSGAAVADTYAKHERILGQVLWAGVGKPRELDSASKVAGLATGLPHIRDGKTRFNRST